MLIHKSPPAAQPQPPASREFGEAQVELRPLREPTPWERRRARIRAAAGRLLTAARDAPRGWWAAGVALLIAGIVALAVDPLVPRALQQASGQETGGPAPREQIEPSGAVLKTLRDPEAQKLDIHVSPVPESTATLAFLTLIGFTLTGLGIRFLCLPRAAAAERLEAIRRHFPEIHEVLGDRRDLQRLLDWVAERTGADVELQGGRCLNVPEPQVDRWIRDQRALARRDPAQRDFEERVRRLLLALLPALVVLAYDPARFPFDRLAGALQGRTVEVQATLPAVFALETAGDWVELAGGTFSMGSTNGDSDERPVHPVTLKPFALGRTEVTVAEYRRCVEAGACAEPEARGSCNWGVKDRDNHPVNCVDWDQARAYADWVGARLPAEAEWEYAARGQGLDRDYPWGNQAADCTRAVIYEGGSGCGRDRTWPVCSKPAGNTPRGLCDIAGNLWEWVEDDYHGDYEGAPADGSAWVDSPRGSPRVLRGGSWGDDPRSARVANRLWIAPGGRGGIVGFRLARSCPSALLPSDCLPRK